MFASKRLTILVILCSLSRDRHELAERVLSSIDFHSSELDFDLVIVDNGSSHEHSIQRISKRNIFIKLKENIGYWEALYWCLHSKNSPLSEKNSDYLYIIESDHVHFDLRALNYVMESLDKIPTIVSARVGEFNVRKRFLFSKEMTYLPFRRYRSLISLRNAITKEIVKFRVINQERGIYIANWHARLPNVSRTSVLKEVFVALASLENFTEYDFFELMHKQSSDILVLDKGIYFPGSWSKNSNRVLAGSWITKYKGNSSTYKETRHSKLHKDILRIKPERISMPNNDVSK